MASTDAAIQLIKKGDSPGRVCNPELAEAPWAFDLPTQTTPIYGPGSSQNDVAPLLSPLQNVIPEEYRTASPQELETRILEAKACLGDRLVILGHHYQRDEVIEFADFRGDSFKLAQQAKTRPAAEYIALVYDNRARFQSFLQS